MAPRINPLDCVNVQGSDLVRQMATPASRPSQGTDALKPTSAAIVPHGGKADSVEEAGDHLLVYGGRIVIVGFGSIGSGVLPLLLRHISMPASRVTIVTAPDRGVEAQEAARKYRLGGVVVCPLTASNHAQVLEPLLGPGDFLLNLSVDVSSCALLRWCHEHGVLYQDTVVEPWAGAYLDPKLTVSERSNYAMREAMLSLKRELGGTGGPTALVTHGANPGLVSHFVKQGLLNIARDTGLGDVQEPASRREWAALARRLGIKVIHVAERDSQSTRESKKPGEFVNTWSVDGFISEGCQPAELGWGSHEKELPSDGAKHTFGTDAAIYLNRPGCMTKVRTWTPEEGPFHGFLITHNEAISIADFLTLRDDDSGELVYRPTVHYAYHPCDAAVASLHELAGKNYEPQETKRLIVDEIDEGKDELGVLLCGNERGAYWYGSQLSIQDARKHVASNSATTLQVTATVLAGLIWAIENPTRGIVEPEEVQEWRRILEIADPYIAPVVGRYTDWTPLEGRGRLFPEPQLDRDDPWQFCNIRVL